MRYAKFWYNCLGLRKHDDIEHTYILFEFLLNKKILYLPPQTM